MCCLICACSWWKAFLACIFSHNVPAYLLTSMHVTCSTEHTHFLFLTLCTHWLGWLQTCIVKLHCFCHTACQVMFRNKAHRAKERFLTHAETEPGPASVQTEVLVTSTLIFQLHLNCFSYTFCYFHYLASHMGLPKNFTRIFNNVTVWALIFWPWYTENTV